MFLRDEGLRALYYEMISDFIMQSFYLYTLLPIVLIHLPIEYIGIIMHITNKQGGYILWIEKL